MAQDPTRAPGLEWASPPPSSWGAFATPPARPPRASGLDGQLLCPSVFWENPKFWLVLKGHHKEHQASVELLHLFCKFLIYPPTLWMDKAPAPLGIGGLSQNSASCTHLNCRSSSTYGPYGCFPCLGVPPQSGCFRFVKERQQRPRLPGLSCHCLSGTLTQGCFLF